MNNVAQLIANLLAVLDLAERASSIAAQLRAQYDTAKAAGVVTAEQDAQVTATYEALKVKGFKFD